MEAVVDSHRSLRFSSRGLGQLFGFLIGVGAWFRPGELVIQILALLVPCWNHVIAAPPGMVFFAAERIVDNQAL